MCVARKTLINKLWRSCRTVASVKPKLRTFDKIHDFRNVKILLNVNVEWRQHSLVVKMKIGVSLVCLEADWCKKLEIDLHYVLEVKRPNRNNLSSGYRGVMRVWWRVWGPPGPTIIQSSSSKEIQTSLDIALDNIWTITDLTFVKYIHWLQKYMEWSILNFGWRVEDIQQRGLTMSYSDIGSLGVWRPSEPAGLSVWVTLKLL